MALVGTEWPLGPAVFTHGLISHGGVREMTKNEVSQQQREPFHKSRRE